MLSLSFLFIGKNKNKSIHECIESFASLKGSALEHKMSKPKASTPFMMQQMIILCISSSFTDESVSSLVCLQNLIKCWQSRKNPRQSCLHEILWWGTLEKGKEQKRMKQSSKNRNVIDVKEMQLKKQVQGRGDKNRKIDKVVTIFCMTETQCDFSAIQHDCNHIGVNCALWDTRQKTVSVTVHRVQGSETRRNVTQKWGQRDPRVRVEWPQVKKKWRKRKQGEHWPKVRTKIQEWRKSNPKSRNNKKVKMEGKSDPSRGQRSKSEGKVTPSENWWERRLFDKSPSVPREMSPNKWQEKQKRRLFDKSPSVLREMSPNKWQEKQKIKKWVKKWRMDHRQSPWRVRPVIRKCAWFAREQKREIQELKNALWLPKSDNHSNDARWFAATVKRKGTWLVIAPKIGKSKKGKARQVLNVQLSPANQRSVHIVVVEAQTVKECWKCAVGIIGSAQQWQQEAVPVMKNNPFPCLTLKVRHKRCSCVMKLMSHAVGEEEFWWSSHVGTEIEQWQESKWEWKIDKDLILACVEREGEHDSNLTPAPLGEDCDACTLNFDHDQDDKIRQWCIKHCLVQHWHFVCSGGLGRQKGKSWTTSTEKPMPTSHLWWIGRMSWGNGCISEMEERRWEMHPQVKRDDDKCWQLGKNPSQLCSHEILWWRTS